MPVQWVLVLVLFLGRLGVLSKQARVLGSQRGRRCQQRRMPGVKGDQRWRDPYPGPGQASMSSAHQGQESCWCGSS